MSNDILYFDKGIVKMTEEGLSVSCFKLLYDGDKLKGKPSFKRYVEYIWYLYSKSSPYIEYSYEDRVLVVEERIFHSTNKGWLKMLGDLPLLRECVDEYKSITMSREDKQYEKYMDDMDSYIDRLMNVPHKKKVKVRVEDVNEETGDKVIRDAWIEIENMDERSNARKEIKATYEMIDIIKERQAKKGDITKRRYLRIFDSAER